MNVNTMWYLIKEGFIDTWKSRKTAISSLLIIISTMLMLGIFISISANIENIIKKAEEQQGIQVYLNDINEQETNELKSKIQGIYAVSTIEYVSKEQALEIVKSKFDDEYKDLLEGFEKDNRLPASFVVKLDNLSQSKNVQAEIAKLSNVKKIQSVDDATEALLSVGKVINIVSIVILVTLLIISVFIISSSIKITMFARRREISIMKYVGATDGFIRMPFIIEGILIGLAGALISTIIVFGTYMYLYGKFNNAVSESMQIFNNAIVPLGAIAGKMIITYLALGIGIGVVGSTVSIKKYLDV